MSLLSTASPWKNDDNNITRKRMSTMRKTMKKQSNQSSSQLFGDDYETDENNNTNLENYDSYKPQSVEQTQMMNNQRNERVNQLINKMSNVEAMNDGSKLSDFNPPPQPVLNNKKPDAYARDSSREMAPDELLPNNPLQYAPPTFNKGSMKSVEVDTYSANDASLGKYNNYKTSYDPPEKLNHKPYYAKMGIVSSNNAPGVDNKLMEKINYMIHLLEENQNEKTNNITEEFILYSFLGIFIIFVVDSFARSGKYVR